jgi:signal transduction histidine kinase
MTKRSYTILIIEDNPATLCVFIEHLKSWGFDLMVARGGESGLRKALQGQPDLILLDIYMPGMDGFEFCRKLKNDPATQSIPVFFLTADSDSLDKIEGLELCAVDYITKPFHPDEVLARINRHQEIHSLRKQLETQNEQLKHEVSLRKQAEEALRKSEDRFSVMAGGIAHDFNNILAPIIGYTEMALGDTPQHNPMHHDLEQVLNAAHRARDLVKQILACSRHGRVTRIPFDIGLIVKEALKLLRASLPTSIEIKQNIQRGMALVDPPQTRQMLVNLCDNAVQAMNGRGILEVSLSEVRLFELDTASLSLRGLRPGPYLKLSVSDTGNGMDASTMERIFDPYFTTKEVGKGAGLGLAVVHGIVKRHEGAITVHSELEKGSIFDVYIPKIE